MLNLPAHSVISIPLKFNYNQGQKVESAHLAYFNSTKVQL